MVEKVQGLDAFSFIQRRSEKVRSVRESSELKSRQMSIMHKTFRRAEDRESELSRNVRQTLSSDFSLRVSGFLSSRTPCPTPIIYPSSSIIRTSKATFITHVQKTLPISEQTSTSTLRDEEAVSGWSSKLC